MKRKHEKNEFPLYFYLAESLFATLRQMGLDAIWMRRVGDAIVRLVDGETGRDRPFACMDEDTLMVFSRRKRRVKYKNGDTMMEEETREFLLNDPACNEQVAAQVAEWWDIQLSDDWMESGAEA